MKYKISPNELRIIEIVGTSRKPKMMKDIAELMSMTKGGMTFLIDKLEKKALSEGDKTILTEGYYILS